MFICILRPAPDIPEYAWATSWCLAGEPDGCHLIFLVTLIEHNVFERFKLFVYDLRHNSAIILFGQM